MPLRQRLFRIYWALERRLAPGLEYAQAPYERRLFEVVEASSRWLDLGCGRALLPRWRADAEMQLVRKSKHLVGVDPDRAAVLENSAVPHRVCADCSALPFADESFDLITANMVVEHLNAPDAQFAEVRRILRPGGRFLFHTPNALAYPTLFGRFLPDALKSWLVQVLEGRAERDRYRTFYRANTVGTIRKLAAASGLLVSKIDFVRSTAVFAMVPPLAAVELTCLRALGQERLRGLRSNLIVLLEKHA